MPHLAGSPGGVQSMAAGWGVYRWVVERTLAWLRQFRSLRVRDERRADIHEAFLSIGCSLLCFRRLISLC